MTRKELLIQLTKVVQAAILIGLTALSVIILASIQVTLEAWKCTL